MNKEAALKIIDELDEIIHQVYTDQMIKTSHPLSHASYSKIGKMLSNLYLYIEGEENDHVTN
jgi:hypothetical protein